LNTTKEDKAKKKKFEAEIAKTESKLAKLKYDTKKLTERLAFVSPESDSCVKDKPLPKDDDHHDPGG
jgi:hypothetical protein